MSTQPAIDREPAGWPEALAAAHESFAERGAPMGAALVRNSDGAVIATGGNRHYQDDDVTAHAEIVTLRRAGAITLRELSGCTLVSTAIPCWMCSGLVVQLGIPRVVAGMAVLPGGEPLPSHRFLEAAGVEVVDLGRTEVIALMAQFTQQRDDWAEDLGTVVGDVDLSVLGAGNGPA